jgi:succinate-acetate transporter protein
MGDAMDGAGESHVSIKSLPLVANPAPLGLAGFALTTFLLSASNAEWTRGTAAWLGYAFAYGGLAQLLAGMWEFRNKNVFGATAFSTYGSFWIGLGLYAELVAGKATVYQFHNDLGWIILAFLIFNTYMLLWSLFVSKAVFAVFLTLEITELLLVIGNLTYAKSIGTPTWFLEAGGVVGIVTAAVAWYTSAAGVVNEMSGRTFLPVGKPLSLARPSETE